MIRIPNLRLGLDETEEKLRERASRALRLAPERLRELRLVKKSVDARDKRDLHYVCTVLVAVEGDEEAALRRAGKCGASLAAPEPPFAVPCLAPPRLRPVVVGLGPAGLFAALYLARAGLRPIVLERGEAVERRRQDVAAFWRGGVFRPESNVQARAERARFPTASSRPASQAPCAARCWRSWPRTARRRRSSGRPGPTSARIILRTW